MNKVTINTGHLNKEPVTMREDEYRMFSNIARNYDSSKVSINDEYQLVFRTDSGEYLDVNTLERFSVHFGDLNYE